MWDKYKATCITHQSILYSYQYSNQDSLPPDTVPATPILQQHQIEINQPIGLNDPPAPPPPAILQYCLTALPLTWEAPLWQNIQSISKNSHLPVPSSRVAQSS